VLLAEAQICWSALPVLHRLLLNDPFTEVQLPLGGRNVVNPESLLPIFTATALISGSEVLPVVVMVSITSQTLPTQLSVAENIEPNPSVPEYVSAIAGTEKQRARTASASIARIFRVMTVSQTPIHIAGILLAVPLPNKPKSHSRNLHLTVFIFKYLGDLILVKIHLPFLSLKKAENICIQWVNPCRICTISPKAMLQNFW
jgi:hypothetical protein